MKFELFQNKKNDSYYFNLANSNGQLILKSRIYRSKPSAQNGIQSVKANAPNPDRYQLLVARNKKPYFNLKAANGHIIATSQQYATTASMNKTIKSIREQAAKADIVVQ